MSATGRGVFPGLAGGQGGGLLVPICVSVAVALAVRLGILYFNIGEEVPAFWPSPARKGLMYAYHAFGMALPRGLIGIGGMTLDEAVLGFQFGDRGIAFPHMLILLLAGKTSYLALQGTQVVIDSLMTIPIVIMAGALSGRLAALAGGLAYGVFTPQAVLSVIPSYGTWLTWGLVLCTFAAYLIVHRPPRTWMGVVMAGAALGVAAYAFGQFRSIITLFFLFAAGWYAVIVLTAGGFGGFTAPARRCFGVFALAGLVCVAATSMTNRAVGETSYPFRSTLGHSLFAGFGQFENPFGVTNSDASVYAYYKQQTGRDPVDKTMGPEYNRWLLEKGLRFIRENPAAYGRMVAARAGRFLFPMFYMDLHADTPSWIMIRDERSGGREARIDALMRENKAKHGVLSPFFGWIGLWNIEPILLLNRVLGYAEQVLPVALPLGIVLAVLVLPVRALATMLTAPLVYTVATLAPIYGPGATTISAYAAALPVVVAGWMAFFALAARFLSGGAGLRGKRGA